MMTDSLSEDGGGRDVGATHVSSPHARGAAAVVAATLREWIQRGRLAPGARIIERRVAAELGVSHIPVREALASLEDEGLVVRLPRRGARVAELSARVLEETSSLRVVLEGLVVERAQERLTADARSELQTIVDGMIAGAIATDVECVLVQDQRFHETLWRLADHGVLLEVSARMRGRMNVFFRAAATSLAPDALRRHAETHQDLLNVILSGERGPAVAAMRQHIEVAAERIAVNNELLWNAPLITGQATAPADPVDKRVSPRSGG